MMAVATKTHLFNVGQAVCNSIGSKCFVKQLIPTVLSSILYRRFNFEKNEFLIKKYYNVENMILKKPTNNSVLRDIHKWILSVLDAFDKDYLREIYLIFYDINNPEKIYENYKVQVQYMGPDAMPPDKSATREELKNSTLDLLKSVNRLDQYSTLEQDKVGIKMGMTYYEDVTPPDYCAPLFSVAKDEQKILKQLLDTSENSFQLGLLNTSFHIVKCHAKGNVFNLPDTASNLPFLVEESIVSENLTEQESNQIQSYKPEEPSVDSNIFTENTQPTTNYFTPLTSFTAEQQAAKNYNNNVTDFGNEEMVLCQCAIPIQIADINMVKCSSCLYLQHCPCMEYIHPNDIPDNYTCPQCDSQINLTFEELEKRKCVSRFRLAVIYIYTKRSFPEPIFKALPEKDRRTMLKNFKQFNIVKKQNDEIILNIENIRDKVLKSLFKKSVLYSCPDSMSLHSPLDFNQELSTKRKKHD